MIERLIDGTSRNKPALMEVTGGGPAKVVVIRNSVLAPNGAEVSASVRLEEHAARQLRDILTLILDGD